VAAADPVRSGFVASLAKPGGNITGMSNINPELEGKRLELLRELRPKLARVAYLAHSGDPMHKGFIEEAQSAAHKAAISYRSLVIGRRDELDNAFTSITRERAEALMVQPLFASNLEVGHRVAELAARSRLLSICGGVGFAEAGGLLFYGANQSLIFRRAATFVDKILKGAKPSDLPVEQPTKFDFIINLKTAKQIGVNIPQSVLFRADKVIK
jgi:putative ABC transport system substrate-binding protein